MRMERGPKSKAALLAVVAARAEPGRVTIE
jgi:hypothetical protein